MSRRLAEASLGESAVIEGVLQASGLAPLPAEERSGHPPVSRAADAGLSPRDNQSSSLDAEVTIDKVRQPSIPSKGGATNPPATLPTRERASTASKSGKAVEQRSILQEQGIYTGSGSNGAGSGSGTSGSMSLLETPTALPSSLFDTLDEIVFRFLDELLWDAFQRSALWIRFWQFVALSERQVTEDDFSLFRVLGRGGFGMVNGCKRAASGKLFAMKVLNKKRVKLKRSETMCLSERNLLASIDSPFVVCLKYAFSTSSDLYLIVDLMLGGTRHSHALSRW